MPFGKKKEAQQPQNGSTFSWELYAKSGGPDNNYFVSSRGLLAGCDFHPLNPESSTVVLAGYPAELPNTAFTIYICSSALPQFLATVLPRIRHPFVLVSGDCDEDVPFDVFPTPNQFDCLEQEAPDDREARLIREKQERRRLPGAHDHNHSDLSSLLEHEKLLHWFCQNWCGEPREKVTTMPIGLDYHTMVNATKEALRLLDSAVMEYESERVPRVECWKRQSQFAFVVSPHGVGLDCHRTWEALVLGCIPIVKSSKIDVLYKDLPVLIVESWDQVTPNLLQKTICDMQSETFNYEKLSLSYWSKLIKSRLSDVR